MDPTDNTVALKASASKLLPQDEKEFKRVSQYAGCNKEKTKKIYDDFKKKGYLKLVWDGKVPQKNKRFYYFISLTASNRDEVLSEIQKYIDFYQEMGETVQKVRKYEEEEQQQTSEINPYVIIHELKIKLKELSKEAEVNKDFTSSSTVYRLHRAFIEKHEELENMIKRVECIALKGGMVKAIDGWQNSIKEVDELKIEMRESANRYDEVCDQLRKFELETQKQNENMKTLLENNRQMKEQQKLLVETIERMSKQQEKMMENNENISSFLESYKKGKSDSDSDSGVR